MPLHLAYAQIKTPLGKMIAAATENALHFLTFEDTYSKNFSVPSNTLFQQKNRCLHSIQEELHAFFEGTLTQFTTPLYLHGSPFQMNVWRALCDIPFASTRSYVEIAHLIHSPSAQRAVGNANGSNPLAIIVPCHRVVCKGGKLGGYSSGIERKKWLLQHEHQKAQVSQEIDY